MFCAIKFVVISNLILSIVCLNKMHLPQKVFSKSIKGIPKLTKCNQQKNSISFYLENNDRDLKIRVSPTKVTVRLDGMQQRLSCVGFNNIQGGAWVLVKTNMVLFEFYVRSHIF